MPLTLEAGSEKQRFVTLQPDSLRDTYRDVLLVNPDITPATIGAIWHPKPPSSLDQHVKGRRVVLHFHGGAFVLGGCRDADISGAAALLLRSPGSSVLVPQYRLSSYPGNQFPAALQDAVTTYAHLVGNLQVPPSDIVLSGDSAGGNLAINLLRYISEHKDVLPEPAGVLLWSPRVDLSVSVNTLASRSNYNADFIPASLFTWLERVFLPLATAPHPDPRDNPYISPLKEVLPTSVPIFIQRGTAELIKDEIIESVERQREACLEAGGRLGVCEVQNAPLDIMLGGGILGFAKEAEEAMDKALAFLVAV